jgi:8-oxo-dGTP pyrophosphatase MutT (NUDIX family)
MEPPTTPAVPRAAATVIVLRGGVIEPEVLLVRRNPQARFMGGAWVFPGGAVDPQDGAAGELSAAIACGRRELAEEAGVRLDPEAELIPFARWITPVQVPIRFDTWFLVAVAPTDAAPRIDGAEIVDSGWWRPAEALAAGERGELLLVFPTIRQLEELARFARVEDLLADARRRRVEPVLPVFPHAGPLLMPDGRPEAMPADGP